MHQHRLSSNPHPADLKSVVDTFKALADPTRTRLLLILASGERGVNDLVDQLKQPQSTVSRHLTVLRSADLVATQRDGVRVIYRLKDAHVGDLVVQAFAHAEHERLELPNHDSPASRPVRSSLEARR
jgi:DNA-binding transcriptional ArsR family regulator